MNYPVWDLGPGAGVLIAVVAILHVFVSHFAVGGGLWLVLTETRARRYGNSGELDFVKSHSRFFVLLTLVFGAISGVGIWLTIGLISPHGTSALIHGYVWGWAMEWVTFFVEIAAALIYYYGWERLDARTHQAVGWIYFIAAYLSLLIINGIITFMLTPGGWLENQQFWTGFFNPSYWPSVLVRTFGAVGIAGAFTLWSASRLPAGRERDAMSRWCAGWALVGLVVTAAGSLWYGRSIGTWNETGALLGAIPVLTTVVGYLRVGLVAAIILSALFVVMPRLNMRASAVLLLLVSLMTMGAAEWMREAGRKPYIIHGYLYTTGLLVEEVAAVTADGMAAHTKWVSPEAADDPARLGRDLYLAWCQPCHTADGYNGLRPYLADWNRETVASLVPRLEHLRALMPPWRGTEDENAALTSYLMSLKPSKEPVWGSAGHDAARAFAVSCGLCHTASGFRGVAESFAGMEPAEIDEFLDEAGDLTDEMPAYFGKGRQRELLVEILYRMGNPGAEMPSPEGSES